MTDKPQTTAKEIEYVERVTYPEPKVQRRERFVPAKDGEKVDALFGTWPDFIKMRLTHSMIRDVP